VTGNLKPFAAPSKASAKSVAACELRFNVTFQSKSQAQDTFGQPLDDWTDVFTTRAKIEPLTGRELFAAQQVNAETTTRITIRYRAGVDASMRIQYAGVNYNILNVRDLGMRHAWIEMMCSSGLIAGDG
jgi:SPP1 family predicted phage head-tail adaptor